MDSVYRHIKIHLFDFEINKPSKIYKFLMFQIS